MAPPAAGAAGGGGGGGQQGVQQQQQQAGFGQRITGIIRIAVFWYFASKFFSPKKPTEPSLLISNLFNKGEPLDMWLYLSEHEMFNDLSSERALVWHETNIPYAVWGPDSTRFLSLKYHPSEALKNNGTLYAHAYFARSGFSPDPNDPEYEKFAAFGRTHPVVTFLPKSKADKRRSLLGNSKVSDEGEVISEVIDESQEESKEDGPVEWVPYWKPNITINLVDDFTRYPHNAVPPNIRPLGEHCVTCGIVSQFLGIQSKNLVAKKRLLYLELCYSCDLVFVDPKEAYNLNVEPGSGNYYPTIFFNEFWLLRDKLIPINDTVTELPLNLEVGPISMTKWQLFLQIDQSFQIHRSYGSMLEGEADELKCSLSCRVMLLNSLNICQDDCLREFDNLNPLIVIQFAFGTILLLRVFLEGNPYLLGITMIVSLLHSVFDFLAFKNDIQFWNKNKSMEGLSAKSVVVSFICQLIVFLYLLDNDTSWMILASSGIGCCIEFWKIGKAMHIEIDRSGKIPMLRFRDRESYAGNRTKEYDDLAMKYLSYVLFFLVACSSVYSLMYERHRSWYSWILSSLTSCVYMFGFIMMCPQLFINYKLKSVAHLPWRQMTYKFLNTIIDDLFAFVIKMPTLHRLSVFRDELVGAPRSDVIFLIYLYQRWVYPVDRTRVNEFGFGGEDETQAPPPAAALTGTEESSKTADEKKTN
ncbi:Cleft lip and palate transmembrane 1 [Dillenia turbinata]|uniref:Cleft lip and palate transmembrane 1 n=1 Tax=Dillenia turbinata TaxID=194707 RepID=A0AAN8UX79_9MAGN